MTVSVQSRGPEFLQRTQKSRASIVLRFESGDSTPSSAKYSLLQHDRTVTLIASLTATVSYDGTYYTIYYDIPAASLTSPLTIGDDWYSNWVITLADASTLTLERDAVLCYETPRCPVLLSDLERRNSALRGDWELPAGKTSFSEYIDEAWAQTISRVIASGIGAHKVRAWYGFREYVARLSEACIARDLMVTRSGASKWQALYDGLMGDATDPRSCEWAWAKLGYRADRNQDGIVDDGAESETKPGSFAQSTDEPGWRGF